ncbi:nucleotide exchange factor GrpE [Aneurinibacillus thermoaerophilus]|uniref:Protein GrpE n=1 Tax=Aneurinibacillus thermoaerophilus TaxID=143495 RepID=A0A1G7Z759_ANETH|nr:nucleotide exchange factor GrpE [Aneurinibacillus thermoaerophilus]MED0674821.1 nucleotide exchange factor GrpE [Aneurinibacillus thermoaerophilus]MED0679771.1 nucleotide exchange factor GrpE [Aneurinibacillus thermoaerophilus]MED0735803.1 nucleotide exchange factor GrpE [Aneurinibacillus thermoaerophilus]MED0758527.1 nucleotide exchange factor GrpE [Aneurinibacillus thermoaerophilus]MED0762241.1 nucleotide exchange factor GrpE [Aneurinibacillus thermoaerophilus]
MTEENKNPDEFMEETVKQEEQGAEPTEFSQSEEAANVEEAAVEQAEAVEVPREQELQAQIQQLQAEKDELYNKYLRAQADLQNFRIRVNREKEQMMKYQSQRVIEALLPVVDNFERAIAASKDAKDASALAEGIEMVFRQLQQVLEQEGVTTVPGVGEPFDPNMHQAVMQEESDEYESGIIIEEFQKGYKLKDRVIRPSMVKVSS